MTPVLSSTNYSLFDSAQYISPGESSNRAVQLVSNATQVDGGIDFGTTGIATVADIQQLSTDYQFEVGSCGGGSPRFQINAETPAGVKNIFVYIGPMPNYTGCPTGWQSSGNLVGAGTVVDASQLGGGYYESWSDVLAAYGSYPVVGIQLVADGGWLLDQTVDIDNTVINAANYTYEAPDLSQCKNGNWSSLTDAVGHSFKNQGDCVSYVATGGQNTAMGK